jgi:hypothetical protein
MTNDLAGSLVPRVGGSSDLPFFGFFGTTIHRKSAVHQYWTQSSEIKYLLETVLIVKAPNHDPNAGTVIKQNSCSQNSLHPVIPEVPAKHLFTMKPLVPPIITITPQHKSKRKKVRFSRDEIVQYVTARSEMTLEETKSIWWSPAEMQEFRHTAKIISRETRGAEWMIRSLEESCNIARQIAKSCSDEMLMEEKTWEHLEPRQDLVDWCRYGHSRRGMERWFCKAHKEIRADTTSKARRRILEMQRCDDDFLRRISERFSRSSRIFARLIGEADAKAAVSLSTVSSSSYHDKESRKCMENVNLVDTGLYDTSATVAITRYNAVCA